MKTMKPFVEVHWVESGPDILRRIETAGRTAYQSEDKISDASAEKFVSMIVSKKHLSVLEHAAVSARVVCDRGVAQEITRHRIASYTQESTRYCNYAGSRFGKELTFILPSFLEGMEENSPLFQCWKKAMEQAEAVYLEMIARGARPEEARSVLPNSLKTELIMTMNLRAWRHFFALRASSRAHPDMQVIAKSLLREFQTHLPIVFADIEGAEQ